MEAYAGEWLQLLIRWVHVITGIAWIGASFYFIWLDNHLRPAPDARDAPDAVGGELWAIHGGGFYHVAKYRVAPSVLRIAMSRRRSTTTRISIVVMLSAATATIRPITKTPMRRSSASAEKSG